MGVDCINITRHLQRNRQRRLATYCTIHYHDRNLMAASEAAAGEEMVATDSV